VDLETYRENLRIDLKDSGAVWDSDELSRCVQRAVADLSRFLPYEQVYEQSLQFAVTAEKWTSAAAAGTYVALANKPIREGSETVKNLAGLACVRDTDYYIDYSNGKITHIASAKIGNAEACTISYSKSQIGVNLSSLTGLIRVNRVEYPVGDVPQSFPSWSVWGHVLFLEGDVAESQFRMSEGKHIAIHYLNEHTAPTETIAGTYPSFLDNTVLLAASAYALLIKALEYEHKSGTDMASSRTALGNIAAIHTLVDAALDKVSSYNGNATTEFGKAAAEIVLAATALTKVDAVAQPNLTDANAALDKAFAQIALAATALEKIDAGTQPNLTDADTALDAFVSAATGAPTTLAKIDAYLAGESESTKAWLLKITTDIADLRDSVKAYLTAANAYLAEVDTTDLQGAEGVWTEEVKHILTAAEIPNAEDFLESGDDSIDVSTILTNIAAALAKIATEATAGKAHLTTGEDKIDKVNIGDNVPELRRDYCNAQVALAAAYRQEAAQLSIEASTQQQQAELYRNYAESALSMARLWDSKRKDFISAANVRTNAALGMVGVAAERMSNIRSYIEQALAYTSIATGFATEASERTSAARAFIEEASQRLAIADRWVAEARERTASGNAFSMEASQRVAIADRWIAEAGERIGSAMGYIAEGNGILGISASFISEASERMAEIDRHMAEAAQYTGLAASDRETANMFKAEAIERRNEAWSIWRDPGQYIGDFSMTSLRQPA